MTVNQIRRRSRDRRRRREKIKAKRDLLNIDLAVIEGMISFLDKECPKHDYENHVCTICGATDPTAGFS